MSTAQKDTVYIDIDDEITTVIEKVQTAKHKIVALVLPKRAAMLQSIVNMKLLKRSADDADKSIVLITSEASLLPLAGAVGVHAAKTLQSKPAIPAGPRTLDDEEAIEAEEVTLDDSKPVGELAGIPADEIDDEIEVDSSDDVEEVTEKPKKFGKKKFKIPNFNKFRVRLGLAAAALILLIVFWVLGTKVWPRANIVIKTDTSTVTADLTVTASPDAEAVNVAKSIVPAKLEELRKTDTEKATATGEKNLGKKAEGSMTLTNCIQKPGSQNVPAGTQFSKDGKVFVSTEDINLPEADYNFFTQECESDEDESGTVDVEAAEAGSSFNISSGSYNSAIAGINAFGSEMKGGTDKIVKVLSQKDVDEALKRVADRNNGPATDQLKQALETQGSRAIIESFKAGKPTVGTSPNVGTETNEATVTVTVVYTMVGVDSAGLDELIKNSIKDQIDLEKQAISNTGLDEAVIRITAQKPNGQLTLTIQTLVTAGPEVNEDEIKQEIMGKKRGETQNILQNRPGVKEVTVDYSPFWVFSTPTDPKKITIEIQSINPEGSENTDAANSE